MDYRRVILSNERECMMSYEWYCIDINNWVYKIYLSIVHLFYILLFMWIRSFSKLAVVAGMLLNSWVSAQEQTQKLVDDILVSPIVFWPKNDEDRIKYLNRQLKESSNHTTTDDAKLHQIVRESRTKLNFFLANSLSLPVSIVDIETVNNHPAWWARSYSERPPIKIEWIPDWIQGSLGVKEISIKITRTF